MSAAPDPQPTPSVPEAKPSISDSKDSALAERVALLERRLEDVILLLSDVYRYGLLQELLMEKEWKAADQETTQVMVEVAGKKQLDDIVPADYATYPSPVIQVVDQLWRYYSQDRFGFTTQLQIYRECGGSIKTIQESDMNTLAQMAQRFGWMDGQRKLLQDEDVMYDLSAPVGGLPRSFWKSPYGIKNANYFLARLMEIDE